MVLVAGGQDRGSLPAKKVGMAVCSRANSQHDKVCVGSRCDGTGEAASPPGGTNKVCFSFGLGQKCACCST